VTKLHLRVEIGSAGADAPRNKRLLELSRLDGVANMILFDTANLNSRLAKVSRHREYQMDA
jgi:hypothetical protein